MKRLLIALLILVSPLAGGDWLYRGLEYSFVGVQAADVYTTFRAIGSGAGQEGNPLAKWFIGSKPATITIKAAGTYAILLALRGMKKRNRVVATVFLVALNVAFGCVAYKNAGIK
jgi:hypothetical protein